MKRAFLFSLLTALSLAGNLLYQIVLVSLFGAGRPMDAYLAAATWPQFLETVLLGSVGFVLIPHLVRAGASGERGLRDAAGHATALATAVFIGAAIVGMPTALPLIRWTNPGFDESQVRLAAELARLHWLVEIAMAVRVCLTAIAVARGRLGRAGLAPVLGSVASLATLALLIDPLGLKAGVAGLLVNVVVQCILLWPFDWGVWPAPRFPAARSRELARAIGPFVAGSVYAKTDTAVDRLLASSLTEGAITFLGYGNRLVVSLSALTVAGVNAVWLPEMSRLSADTAPARLRELFLRGLDALLLVTLFIAALIPFFSTDLLTILMRRGAFDAANVAALTGVVVALSGVFLAGSIGSLTATCFYSQGDTRTPNLVIALAYTVAVALRLATVREYGFTGIAWATSAGAVLSLALQLLLIRRRWTLFGWRWLAGHAAGYAATAGLAAAVAAATTAALAPLPRLAVGLPLAALLYAAVVMRFGGAVPRSAWARLRALMPGGPAA